MFQYFIVSFIHSTYTNVYAPVVIDSSSSDVEEVDYSQVEDGYFDTNNAVSLVIFFFPSDEILIGWAFYLVSAAILK